MRKLLLLAIVASILPLAGANAQHDHMRLGESMTPTVVKRAPKPPPDPRATRRVVEKPIIEKLTIKEKTK